MRYDTLRFPSERRYALHNCVKCGSLYPWQILHMKFERSLHLNFSLLGWIRKVEYLLEFIYGTLWEKKTYM